MARPRSSPFPSRRWNNAQRVRGYSRRRMRNERVNVAYFTPMKTARIITSDRGRTRKFSAAVDAASAWLTLRPLCFGGRSKMRTPKRERRVLYGSGGKIANTRRDRRSEIGHVGCRWWRWNVDGNWKRRSNLFAKGTSIEENYRRNLIQFG